MSEAALSPSDFALLVQESAGASPSSLPLVVALHGRSGTAADAIVGAREIFGAGPSVLAPQAARPCNPLQSNGASYPGYSWYLGSNAEQPEPASFGDALAQLELLLDARRGEQVLLLGYGQGAVLALTLALHGFECVAGVAVDTCVLPRVEGWTLPSLAPRSLPCLLTSAHATGSIDALAARGMRCEFEGGTLHARAWLSARSCGVE